MYIERPKRPGTLAEGNITDGREEGKGNRLHVRAVRPQVGASPSDPVRADRPGKISGLVPSLQATELEPEDTRTPAASQDQDGRVARRDDHKRVTCSHCGARVLTRISGAMWGHTMAGSECTGSKTWDHVSG